MSVNTQYTTYREYIDLQDMSGSSNAVPTLEGGIYYGSGSIVMNSALKVDGKITNVTDPTSAQHAATKAYVDAQLTAQDLDFSTDSGTGAVDLDSQTLAFAGSSGLDVTHSGQTVTFAIDVNEVSAETGVQDADALLIYDNSAGASKKMTRANLLGSATAAFSNGLTSTTISGSSTLQSAGNFTVGPAQYGLTTAGALKIASMSANWTNAGRTVADAGILTTVDINGGTIDGATLGGASAVTITNADMNGGSIDGVVIGAASAAAGTFAAIAGTTISGTVGSLTSLKIRAGSNIGIPSDTDLLTLESGQLDIAGVVSGSGNAEFGGNLTIGPAQYGLTSAGALDIASMAANWTNASRTVADMGTVTTMDLNGGSIDGTNIGAASPGTGKFTTLTSTGYTILGDNSSDEIGVSGSADFRASVAMYDELHCHGAVEMDANVTLGNAASDVITVTGRLTASQGAKFSLPVDCDSTLNVDGATTLNGTVTLGNASSDVTTVTSQLTCSQGAKFTLEVQCEAGLVVDGAAEFEGAVTLGNATGDDITVTGRIASDFDPKTDNTYDLGGSGLEWKDLYVDGVGYIDSVDCDTIKVGDLTNNRVVIAGASGELEDDSNFTFDGTTLTLGSSQDVKARSYITYSDAALKENVETVTDALDMIQGLRGVSYDLKDGGKREYGFIAQEVQNIVPEVVHTSGEQMGIDYTRITSLLVEAVKTQQAEIEALKNKLDK